jgi:hypothetical protein
MESRVSGRGVGFGVFVFCFCGVAQVVECLPSKCEALSLNPSNNNQHPSKKKPKRTPWNYNFIRS